MDRIADLTAIVQHEVEDYAVPAYKAQTYFVGDEKRQIYTVIVVPGNSYPIKTKAGITVMARVVEDKVVIDQDITDRPLYEALMEAGIPREQIILAYAGEKLPGEQQEEK
jgi:XisI protein